jgi:4,5-DOPA dioxygenase extradiol
MPAMFVGHGSPMNAIEDNQFSRAWLAEGRGLPRPKAVLCVSAHWETAGTRATAQERPKTIHDFYGFPDELYGQQYPAPGSPQLAALLRHTIAGAAIGEDHDWGLDHGSWSVLHRLFPRANVPVVQLSLDRNLDPAGHYALGRALRPLRRRGVLILGSGNIVHNLRMIRFEEQPYDWAVEFDQTAAALIRASDHRRLIDYRQLGGSAALSVPTNEHYLPLLYVLALQEEGEPLRFFCEELALGSLSMRSLRLG